MPLCRGRPPRARQVLRACRDRSKDTGMTAAASTSTAYEARFWDRIARKYASDPIKDTAGYERTLARTRELLTHTDTVLEIGCGTGTTALKLAPSVQRRHLRRDDHHRARVGPRSRRGAIPSSRQRKPSVSPAPTVRSTRCSPSTSGIWWQTDRTHCGKCCEC